MNDTSKEIEEKIHEMMRKKSPSERLKMGSSMYDAAKHLATCGILREFPNISKLELQQELFIRFYGNDFTPAQQEKILLHLRKHFIQKS